MHVALNQLIPIGYMLHTIYDPNPVRIYNAHISPVQGTVSKTLLSS